MKIFLKGILSGILLACFAAGLFWVFKYKMDVQPKVYFKNMISSVSNIAKKKIVETFAEPIKVSNKGQFGQDGQFTFELHREGTFAIEGDGVAWQKSDSYRDAAYIRSTYPLPETYKISVVVGDIDYGLDKIAGLRRDPDYPEGPLNENGVYLLAITDEVPVAPHTNIWWHQHRKLVIDVDNNVWGHGMPNPVFMAYFDTKNKLNAFNGVEDKWQKNWVDALKYEEDRFYRVEIEKTKKEFIMKVFSESGQLLKEARVALKEVWHEGESDQEYFVVGEPHENYYVGSMKIKGIVLEF